MTVIDKSQTAYSARFPKDEVTSDYAEMDDCRIDASPLNSPERFSCKFPAKVRGCFAIFHHYFPETFSHSQFREFIILRAIAERVPTINF